MLSTDVEGKECIFWTQEWERHDWSIVRERQNGDREKKVYQKWHALERDVNRGVHCTTRLSETLPLLHSINDCLTLKVHRPFSSFQSDIRFVYVNVNGFFPVLIPPFHNCQIQFHSMSLFHSFSGKKRPTWMVDENGIPFYRSKVQVLW